MKRLYDPTCIKVNDHYEMKVIKPASLNVKRTLRKLGIKYKTKKLRNRFDWVIFITKERIPKTEVA